MSILLDIGQDLSKLSSVDGLIYRDIQTENLKKGKDNYILIKEDGLDIIDIEIEDSVHSFCERLKLFYNTDANKTLVNKGEYSKKSMSVSPLGILFKRDTIVKNKKWDKDWGRLLSTVLEDGFDIIIQNTDKNTEVTEQLMVELKEKCTKMFELNKDDLISLINKDSDDSGKIFSIAFDVDIKYYMLLNKFYYKNMNKAFGSTDKTVKYDGDTYGCSTFINLNANKRFLISSIYSDYDDITNLKLVENMDYIKVKDLMPYNRTVVNAIKCEYIWEYDTKEIESGLKKNNYIGKSKKYAIGTIEAWHIIKYLESKVKQANGKDATLPKFKRDLANAVLNGNISRLKVNKLKSIMMKDIIKDATLKLPTEGTSIIGNINNILSIEDAFINLKGGSTNMNIIKQIQSGNISIENDRQFSYLFGQVVYYINSQGREAKEKKTMGYLSKYLRKSDSRDLILKDMMKYKANIKRTKLLGNVISTIMKYEIQDRLDQTMFLAGTMDENIFYQKQTNESEEI